MHVQNEAKHVARQQNNEHSSLKTKIEDWLEAEGITFSESPDFNSFFHIVANLKNVQVHVSEPKVRRGVLAVQAVVALNEDQLAKVEKLKPEEKRPLFLSLFAKLDRSEYLFMLQEDFNSKSWLRIQRTLYIEDLTRSSLLFEMKDLNMKFVNLNYELNDALESFARSGASEEQTAIYT